jgi:hypothetical protein
MLRRLPKVKHFTTLGLQDQSYLDTASCAQQSDVRVVLHYGPSFLVMNGIFLVSKCYFQV